MNTNRRFSSFALVSTAVMAACGAMPAFAADDAVSAAPTLEEVVVTAQKREENLQNVGTSITAVSGSELRNLGVTDVTALAGMTPGMQFNQYGATVTVYNLRGVSQNDFSDHQEAPIAVYEDDAYVASMGALAGAPYDLQRVEILRGPQGTLFGRNATGGLIHYISEKPKFDDDGYLSATAGNFGTIDTEGALNTALSDTVAIRGSFATNYHSGYIHNLIGPDINNENQYAGRVQLLFKPSDKGEIVLKLHAVNNGNEVAGNYSWAASAPDATGRGHFTPGATDFLGYANPSSDPFVQEEGERGIFNRTVWGATLHVNWKFDGFDFTSVTDYLRLQKRYREDSSMSPSVPNPAIPPLAAGPDAPYFVYDTLQHYHQASEELRLNGTAGDLKWIAGLYFLDYHTDNGEYVNINNAFGGPSQAVFALGTQSESIFGQLEYQFSPGWNVIGGLRYTSDQKYFDYSYYAPGGPISLTYNPSNNPAANHTYDNVTGKFEVNYKFGPESMVYASVNRGAKGGGWSAPSSGVLPATLDALPYKQETLTSYELGEKFTFWDGRARLNGAVFHYDYNNYQGFFLAGLTQVVQNIDATVSGGELELALAPVRGMNLQLGLSHLDTTAKNVPLPAGGLTTTEMPQAPAWSVDGVASYEWVLPQGKLAGEIDAKWNAHQYLELENGPVDYEKAYTLANARLTYTGQSGNWDVAAWVKNLKNTYYRVYNLDLSALGINQGVYGPPRTYGVSFNYRWGTSH